MFKKAIIQTSNSIWPDYFPFGSYNLSSSTWFYDEEKTERTVLTNSDTKMLAIELKRSAYTHRYIRKCKKIDEMLGEIFGMMGLISAILFGIYSGFNNWSF